MAFRNFPNKSQAELETWLGEIQDAQVHGAIVSASSGDSSSSTNRDVSTTEVERKILQDLATLDPGTYGDHVRTTRTQPKFL